MEEDYEGGETNGTRKTHSYPFSRLSLSHDHITTRKKEHYMKHHKNVSKENRGIRRVEKLHRSISHGNNL